MTTRTLITSVRCGVALAVTALMLTGCSIPFTTVQTVASDIVLPASLANLPDNIPAQWREQLENWNGTSDPMSLGEFCDLPNIDSLLEQAGDAIPAGVMDRISISSVTLESVTLVATQNDFSSVTGVGVRVLVNGEQLAEYKDSSSSGFGDTIELTARRPFDLMRVLDDDSIDCFENQISFEGGLPDEDVVFTVEVKITVSARIRLLGC